MDDVISLGVGEPDFDTPRADRRGRRRVAPQRPDPLHVELRHDRAAAGARRASRAPLRRRLRPGDRAADHRRGVGGGRPRAPGNVRPRRRGDPPRAVVRRLRAGRRVRRRHGPSTSRPASRTTSPSIRRRSRRRSRRGRRRCSSATRATRPAPSCRTTSRTSSPRSPSGTTSSSTATRSTTGWRTARTATGRSARCRGCATGRSSWAVSRRPTR